MKIVFVLPGRGRSGGVKSIVMEANHLLDRGHNVRILYQKKRKSRRGICRSILLLLIHRRNNDWLKEFNGQLNSFTEIMQCQFDKDEIIIGSGMWASGQMFHLASIPNRKLQFIQGAHIGNMKETRDALKSPIPKIVVSSFLKPLVESYGGEVLGVISNGVDTKEYFSSVPESERDGIGAIYSSHVSKDPEILLTVLEMISRQRPDIPVRIFSHGRRPKEIKKKCFWRLPSIEKAREIYSKSKVWIVASRSEGFSLPVLEAMACGCSVVATDCGGPRDIIRDGENGFLVEVGNAKQILDRVEKLLDDDKLRKRICLEAKKTVNKFTWEKSVYKLEDVLRNLATQIV